MYLQSGKFDHVSAVSGARCLANIVVCKREVLQQYIGQHTHGGDTRAVP